MAEKEQTYRQEREPAILQDQRKLAFRGQWFAAILSVLFGIGAVYLGMNGHEVTGAVLGGSTVVSIVSSIRAEKEVAPGSIGNLTLRVGNPDLRQKDPEIRTAEAPGASVGGCRSRILIQKSHAGEVAAMKPP